MVQKVADSPLGGKGRQTQKVDRSGSYAILDLAEITLIRLPLPISLIASRSPDDARKHCATRDATGRRAGERDHAPASCVANPGGRPAGARGAGRCAATAP